MKKKKMLKTILLLAAILTFMSFCTEAETEQLSTSSLAKSLNTPTDAKYLTGNWIKMPIQNDAVFGQNPYTGRAGTEWPQGTGNMYIFGAGIWIGAQIPAGGGGLKKVVSYGYNPNDGYSEWGPGIIVSPDVADHGVAGPPPTYPILLLTEVSSWSHDDSLNWPLKDSLGNPKFVSAEDSWCFYNDADINYHDAQASPGDQLNILVKQTTYAFNSEHDKDVIFMVWDIYNQGDDDLDSVYIGITVDPDLGNATDDMIGFDSTRNMCWVYNYDLQYDQDINGTPGFMGFRLLEGPEDSSGNQLGLTSLTLFTIDSDPANDEERYNLMAGLTTSGDPRVGGPFDIDVSPNDKRFCQSTGPFNLATGDSVRVDFCIVAGANENILKANSDYAQMLYDAGFPSLQTIPTPALYARGFDKAVDLVWTREMDGYVANYLDREYHHEGYNIYQGESAYGPWKKIATYDVIDTVTFIYADVYNPEIGAYERILVQKGTNSGLESHLFLTYDYLKYDTLFNDSSYYYAVTAYCYDANNMTPYYVDGYLAGYLTETLESPILQGVECVPVFSSLYHLSDTASHTSGTSDGMVIIEYLDQSEITDHTYKVTFNPDLTWNLIDTTLGLTLLSNQTNQSGDYSYPILDGMMARVIGEEPGIKSWSYTPSEQRWLSGVNWDGGFFFGGLDIGYYFLGSSITNLSAEFVDVEIRFSPIATQYAYNYLRGGIPNYGYQGYFDCPFTIWDVTSDPERQLNAAFVEWTGSNSYDSTWMPDSTDEDTGGREYLFILNSNYSDTALTWYTEHNISADANLFDVLYAMWPRIRPGHSPSELADGQIFKIEVYKPNTPADVFTFTTYKYTDVKDEDFANLPRNFVLKQNYPNPFNPFTIIEYSLPKNTEVRLFIYNILGQKVKTLVNEYQTAGTRRVTWEGKDEKGNSVASGIYFCKLSTSDFNVVKKMILIK